MNSERSYDIPTINIKAILAQLSPWCDLHYGSSPIESGDEDSDPGSQESECLAHSYSGKAVTSVKVDLAVAVCDTLVAVAAGVIEVASLSLLFTDNGSFCTT